MWEGPAYCGAYSPSAGRSGMNKKAGQATLGKQAWKQHSSKVCASVPALSSCPDLAVVIWSRPCPSGLGFCLWSFIAATESKQELSASQCWFIDTVGTYNLFFFYFLGIYSQSCIFQFHEAVCHGYSVQNIASFQFSFLL